MEYSSLGEAWVGCMSLIINEGVWVLDGQEKLLEKMNLSVCIRKVSEQDVIIKNYANQGRIELMRIKHESQDIISPFVVSYGKALYCNQGVDQIEYLIKKLKNKRETKALTISLHIPGESYATCLSLLDCKIRNDSLQFTAVYRSQNVFGSQPGNILALAKVQKKIAEATNVRSGNFNLYVVSAHIYEPDILAAKEILKKVVE
jgi:thymidylate synthase